MDPVLESEALPVPTPASAWEQTKTNIGLFCMRGLEAIARAGMMVVLIFVHRGVDWALDTAFPATDWHTYHLAIKGGALIGFSLVYAMLMFDIGVLFWPKRR